MATPMTPDQYIKALRNEGVRVTGMDGWRTRNRNHKGAWGPVNGVLIHHTAGVSKTMDRFVRDGTAALPGPLCHGLATKAGRVVIPGYGRANHAGLIAANALNSLIAEDGKHPKPGPDSVDGNSRLYGLEIENKGDGKDPYPEDQYDQSVRWAAAICRHHKWTAESIAGHKEVTGRKIDPSFSMDRFRDDVAARLRHSASWSPGDTTTPTEPTTPTTPAPTTPGTGVSDMRLTQLSRPESLTIPAGADRMVYFTADIRDDPNEHGEGGYTLLSSAATYTGTVSVWIPATGAGAQTRVGVLAVQELADATNSTSSTADVFTQEEAHVANVSMTGFLPAGRKLKVTLRNNGDQPVTVTRVDLRLLSAAE